MRIFLVLTTFIALLAPPAFAQCVYPLGHDLPDGHLTINLSATQTEEVQQDVLVANLSKIARSTDSITVQNEVNTAMKSALDLAKADDSIQVRTGVYRVHETTDRVTKEQVWSAQQSITLRSKDAETLLALSGKLQEMGLVMSNLGYTVDPKATAKAQDELMEAALIQLQSRAERAAKALNKTSAELRNVTVNDNQNVVALQSRFAATLADSASISQNPVAAGGQTTVSLTVNAVALLKP